MAFKSITIKKKHSTIIINEESVVKFGTPDRMRIVYEKSIRAHDLASRCGLFTTPQIYDFVEREGMIVFERMDLTPLFQVGEADKKKVAEHLGSSLAYVHQNLTLPDEMRIPLPSRLPQSSENVFIHGDLTGFNVCLTPQTPPLCIIDWEFTNGWINDPLPAMPTYGPFYFDVSWFIGLFFFYRPSLSLFLGNGFEAVPLAFLKSYFDESGRRFNPNEFIAYMNAIFDMRHFQRRLGRHLLLRAGMKFFPSLMVSLFFHSRAYRMFLDRILEHGL